MIQVVCKPDGTSHLDAFIPYSIAMTLEVKEETNLRIHQQIQQGIRAQVATRVNVR